MSFHDTDEFLTGDFYLGDIGKHSVAREPTVQGGRTVRTAAMKVSPSMRQLEEILKEKLTPQHIPDTSYNPEKSYDAPEKPYSAPEKPHTLGAKSSMSSLVPLEEEDEDSGIPELAPPPPFLQDELRRRSRDSKGVESPIHLDNLFAPPPRFLQPGQRDSWGMDNSHTKANNRDLFLQRNSTCSVQTFQTARSHESQTPSISTIEQSGYSSEGTPVLSQPATFHDVRRVSIQSKVGGVSKTDLTYEQDDTLIDEGRSSVGSAAVSSGSTKNSTISKSETDKTENFDSSKSELTERSNTPTTSGNASNNIKMASKPLSSSPTLSLSPFPERLPLSKPSIRPINHTDIPSPTIKGSPLLPQLPNTPKTSMIPQNISTHTPKTSMIPQNISVPPKSPMGLPKNASKPTKSYSSYTLNEPKASKPLPILPKHKRSNTVGDLSKMKEPKEKKKFSFKALFKLKSKSNGLSESLPKAASKSYSTPNLAQFNQPKVSEKSNNEEKNEKSNNDWKNDSKSFRNVFKKNKSSENLSQFNQPPVAVSKTEIPSPKYVDLENSQASPKKAFKSNTNFNLIREVSDDEKEAESDSENEEFFNEYDADNILQNPPKKLVNTRYDQEMLLVPDSDEVASFGSPFKVRYDSDSNLNSPKEGVNDKNVAKIDVKDVAEKNFYSGSVKPPASRNDKSFTRNDKNSTSTSTSISPNPPFTPSKQGSQSRLNSSTPQTSPILPSSPEKDSLLGEALFPKSLNQQEVESIVSLERSRSMKSLRSNKRNSFVNYNGSNENIVYGGPPLNGPSGITRSNSILKNSTSRKGLNAELLYNSIDTNIEGEEAVNSRDPLVYSSQFAHKPLSPDVSGNYDIINNTTFDSANDYLDGEVNYALDVDFAEQNDFSDLLEFTDYIDVDNLDFTSSPQAPEDSPRVEVDEYPVKHLEYGANSDNSQGPASSNLRKPEIPQIEISPSPGNDQPTYNPETSNATSTPTHESFPSWDAFSPDHSVIESSPILETAYRAGRKSADGENVYDRPISMSFRGLKGPSFGGKLAHQNMRSTDSHQSFNISFGDDSDSGVGGGFGSESDDDRENTDSLKSSDRDGNANVDFTKYNYRNTDEGFKTPGGNNKTNSIRYPQPSLGYSTEYYGDSNASESYTDSSYTAQILPRPATGSHSKIPSVSDTASTSSSPRSLGSMISRKWKRSPNLGTPSPSPVAATVTTRIVKNGVRFSSRIILYDTYNGQEYDRHPETATCNQLTPLLAQQIKDELNEFKNEMEIHRESKCFTHFF